MVTFDIQEVSNLMLVITMCLPNTYKYKISVKTPIFFINPLTPNDPYMGCAAPLTSRCCILYIYSTNIRTEYFKHAA